MVCVQGCVYPQVLTICSKGLWPVSFVAQVGQKLYSYTPKSGFVLFLNSRPSPWHGVP
jgi:hypothetical protein